ncbi:response regulator [Deinococcus oregonensis]|uniref:Response regulator n=1 Tax=Deinococcus oregonensis TaxID=1805970 RepID=A0ABV6AVD6_9DEIO
MNHQSSAVGRHPDQVSQRPYILLVDDNPLDIELTLLALAEHGLHEQVLVIDHGQEALDFLQAASGPNGRWDGLPSLILLDLNMPGVSGAEILKQIRNQSVTRRLCVVILSSSDLPQDHAACETADAYLIKPLRLEQFIQVVGEVLCTILSAVSPAPPRRAQD